MVKKDTISEKPPGPIIQYTQSKELDDYDSQRRMIKKPEPEIANVYVIDGEEYEKTG